MSEGRSGHKATTQSEAMLSSLKLLPFLSKSLGFGFYWAWINAFFFSPLLFLHSDNQLAQSSLWEFVFMLTTAVAMFVVARLPVRFLPFAGRAAWSLASAGLMTIGTVISALAPSVPGLSSIVGIVGPVMAGLGASLLVPIWGEYYGSIGAARASLSVPLALVTGTGLYFLSTLLAPVFAVAITALYPAVSILLVTRDSKSVANRSAPTEYSRGFPLPWTLAFGAVIYGILGNLIRSTIVFTDMSAFLRSGRIAAIACLVFAALFAACTGLLGRDPDLTFTYRPTIPIVITGCLLLPLLGDAHGPLAVSIVSSGYMYFYVFSWVTYSDIAFRLHKLPSSVFAWGRSLDSMGFVIGNVISYILLSMNLERRTVLIVISVIAIYLLILVPVIILKERDVPGGRVLGESRVVEPLVARCEMVAEEHRLSNRELTILTLLAQGRSLPYIERVLFITHNTAKTHAKNIYQKLGVHTRQEMLDLLLG
ncbi:MAG: LuxR C-terminal-related transcriptional regulator [Coriobacteriia bacterium]